MSGIALLWFAGMAMFFAGERLWPEGAGHVALVGVGLVLVVAAIAGRARSFGATRDPGRRQAQRHALIWTAVGTSALLLYATTTTTFSELVGFDEDAQARWYGAMTSLWPVLWLLGAVPTFVLDRALAGNPVMLPATAARSAVASGLSTALALALLFPVNYLANAHNVEWDVAYFRTTKAGTSTLALVRSLPEPVHATLFFTPGSDVKEQAVPYFKSLAEASSGRFTWAVVDQAVDPALSEALKVRENGYVALARGDVNEKFKIGTELDRAKRELKQLDSTVQKHLLKLAKGQRTAYVLVGHGEASSRELDDPLRKLNLFKKLLEGQNYKVKNLGAAEGSADAIPDDAALLVIAAPTMPLLPEEERAIGDYLARGGSLLLLAELVPGAGPDTPVQPLAGVLAQLGLKAGEHHLAHAQNYISQRRGKADRHFLVSNRFGSHTAVSTLSKNSAQLYVVVPTAVSIEQLEGDKPGKITALVRSFPDTWEDANHNFDLDADETGKVFELAQAVEGPEGDGRFRAIVVGDVSVFADAVLQFSQGNAQLAVDSLRWLVGDDELAGDTESEQDVRIQHTRDDDVMWFYGTIFAVPLTLLLAGLVIIRIRRKS